MILISAWTLFLLANRLYLPLFSDMLILMIGEGIDVPSVVVKFPFKMCWTREKDGLPLSAIVEYMSISLSPVREIDVSDRVYLD